MLLQYLVENLEDKEVIGDLNIPINKIEYDSKKIEKGDLFVAIKGLTEDGHEYINEAIEKGAAAVISSKGYVVANESVTYVKVQDTRIALAKVASTYYDNPASKLKIIGITGTKGKTTTAYMIRDILLSSGKKTGSITYQ